MTGRLGRREFLKGSAAVAAMVTAPAIATERNRPTNILFILADDMGYADLSSYGSRHIRTPVLDRLASGGVRLTDAYSNSPVCSPTRLALITGRYHTRWKTGLIEPFRPGPWGDQAIPAGQPTFPALLRNAGYATSLIGKWHLGPTPENGPLANGYEYFFGFLGGAIDYFTHEYMGEPALRSGKEIVRRKGYLTTILADEAIQAIRKAIASRRPFAVSLHFNAPHWPWEGPEDSGLGTQGAHFDGGSLDVYAQMMESLDRNIGRVLKELERSSVDRNTLVIFTSDNGGERFSDEWPFRGKKGLLLEGGIRVPAIVRFPERLPADKVSAQPSLTMDWMPTILDAAGIVRSKQPEMDGLSLLEPLANGEVVPRTLFWRFQGHRQRAARRGRWKYLRIEDNEFLFDLSTDTLERANRARAEAQILAELKLAWEEWNKEMASDETIPGFCQQPSQMAGELPTGPGTNCKPLRNF